MFRRLGKLFLSLAAIGGIIALAVYISTSHTSDDTFEDEGTDEQDTFNLDSDLEPIGKREYVPLSRNANEQTTNENH